MDNYNSRVVAWQQQLQAFSADASALAPQGDAQVTMENHTSQTLDFYIDNEHHCRALFNLICTAQTKSGSHTLAAKSGDTVVSSAPVVVQAGPSFTWTAQQAASAKGVFSGARFSLREISGRFPA